MTRLLTLLALVLALPASTQLASAQPDRVLDARQALTDGVLAGDADAILGARATLALAAEADGPEAAWATYYGALADYRLAYTFWSADADRAAQHAASGADALADLRRQRGLPDGLAPEAAALQSALLGAQMGLDPSQAMSLGSVSTAAIEEAARLDADNPRVQLIHAQTLLNTPEEWGGDPDRALALLQASTAGFDVSEAGDALAPTWGAGDAYAWLGMAHLMRGEAAEARVAIEAAERLTPNSEFVQFKLKPWLGSVEGETQAP
ncbi:MAG: hypothetical protein AAF845_05285 [Bacteroidota bacterium]